MSNFLTTVDELQAAGLSVDNDTEFSVINPHLVDAEVSYLNPILGSALWDAAIAGLAEPTLLDKWTVLLPYLQKPIAFQGYFRFFKISRGQLNHRGFSRDQSEYSQAAPKYEIDEIKTELICQADYALDQLIKFLGENQDIYTEWSRSDFYELNGGVIIPTASIFDKYVKIGCSGRAFAKLKQYRVMAERGLIRTICQELFDQVSTEINSIISPEVTALLPYLRAVVAYDAMSRGIKMMNFNYLDSGIYLFSFSDGNISKTAISTMDAKMLAGQWQQDYADARVELIEFLKDNITDYPAYSSSKCYASQPISMVVKYDNSIEKKHFGL
jgi:hypothetical protein